MQKYLYSKQEVIKIYKNSYVVIGYILIQLSGSYALYKSLLFFLHTI